MENNNLLRDQTVYVQLTANTKYVDVLCINCYECVKFHNVDKHSKTCAGRGFKDEKLGLDLDIDLKRVFGKKKFQEDTGNEDVTNEKIFKLIKAIRGRLVEV
jgi:hypothetical protein